MEFIVYGLFVAVGFALLIFGICFFVLIIKFLYRVPRHLEDIAIALTHLSTNLNKDNIFR